MIELQRPNLTLSAIQPPRHTNHKLYHTLMMLTVSHLIRQCTVHESFRIVRAYLPSAQLANRKMNGQLN